MKKTGLLLIVFLSVGLWSCKKDAASPIAYLRMINLSPNSTGFDLYAGSSLLVGNVGYGSSSNYIQTIGGTAFTATISPAGSATISIAGAVSLTANTYNSIFLYDSLANVNGTVITDDRTAPPAGKVNIRFFNFVDGGNTVDILRAGSTKLFSLRSFNDQNTTSSLTAYTAFDPGPFSVSAVISGTTVLITSLPSIDATAGKSYTLVLKGFPGDTVSLTAIADN